MIDSWRIDITSGKPGRAVAVVADEAGNPVKARRVAVQVAGHHGRLEWAWLSPEEARAVAKALTAAALLVQDAAEPAVPTGPMSWAQTVAAVRSLRGRAVTLKLGPRDAPERPAWVRAKGQLSDAAGSTDHAPSLTVADLTVALPGFRRATWVYPDPAGEPALEIELMEHTVTVTPSPAQGHRPAP